MRRRCRIAVKREDEQEFARFSAANLMFCEDAGRQLKAMLDTRADIADFHVRVEHHEACAPTTR